jgi:esterase/lipase superfamily enzyme
MMKTLCFLIRKLQPRDGSGVRRWWAFLLCLFWTGCAGTRPEVGPAAPGAAPAVRRGAPAVTRPRAASPVKRGEAAATVKVHFGTNRLPSSDPNVLFASGNAHRLVLGTQEVTVDANHVVGEIKTSVHLQDAPQILAEAAFLRQLQTALRDDADRKLLIFVHGYNVSFVNAVKRAAQLKYDLAFKGEAACFSWPSRGSLLGYWADESAVREAEPFLQEFLQKVIGQSGAHSIYVIAHSMGNRAFTSVIPKVRQHLGPGQRIKEIMLAAPDIDAGVFVREIAPAMQATGYNTTLYSSRKDKALWGSWLAHGFSKRAGQITGVKGLESVDASSTNTSRLGLGHSYYAEQSRLLEDLRGVLRGLRPPQRLETLEALQPANAEWLLRP